MKVFVAVFLLISAQNIVKAQKTAAFGSKTKIYLVRHAEKQSGNDPVLTENGNKRAGALLLALKNKGVRHIYVTQFKRTQMTGDSLRIQLGIDTVQYKADTTGEDVLNKILAHNDAGKTILIIGHSNTIPKIIKQLGAADFEPANIPDAEFDNLYLMTFKKKKVAVRKMKYGESSVATAKMQ
jgi:broad specificity phosphatase PhoE